ncbi:MAG: DNA primase [Oscillospiraceae bacterium]|nr:DNA primase [Oscillospiraceae bacterium]
MAFPENFIQELTERNDIVDVVGSYVRLDKRSGANYFGLCPFHNERTPSFSVNPSGQFYYCFGCGKGGGVINFMMEIENLSYPEAVASLAKRAGMALPEESEDPFAKQRARLLRLNREAARFFYEQLATPAGGRAAEYMRGRGISPVTARRFGLGYAPQGWDSTIRAMRAKGYTEEELVTVDLARRRGSGGCYDSFRDRLMFPIIDVRGEVLGFSGRVLGDGEPKYLNSRDTPVFTKGRQLFAMNLAKKSRCGYIILSEGNIDIVSLHQAGFDSAVASLGTSLTPEQARLLSRYTGEVIIAYDNDGAGIKASQRAIGILERLDLKVKVLKMTGAKDPDEFIRTRGADAFRNLLEGSEDQLDYRLGRVTERYDLTKDEQKVAFLQEATDLLAQLPSPVVRQVYAGRVAGLAGVGQDAVAAEVERRRKRKLGKARREEELSSSRPERGLQPADRALRYSDPVSAAAEEGVIRLLYLEPALLDSGELPEAEEFSSEALEKIYRTLRGKLAGGAQVSVGGLSADLTREEMNLLVSILQKPEALANASGTLRDYTRRIREQKELSDSRAPLDLRALSEQLRQRKGYHP